VRSGRRRRGDEEERRGEEEEEEEATDIKSNNPHLAGGEKTLLGWHGQTKKCIGIVCASNEICWDNY